MFITIWVWSFAILMLSLMYTCYQNPGKMYLDVFILMTIIVAIPGVAIANILYSIYMKLFVYRSRESIEALKKKTWIQIEEIHTALQIMKGKF